MAEGYTHLRVGAVGGDGAGRGGGGGGRGGSVVVAPAPPADLALVSPAAKAIGPAAAGTARPGLGIAGRSTSSAVRLPVHEQPDRLAGHLRKTIGFGVDCAPKWTSA